MVKTINPASSYFNTNWQRYKDAVKRNTLYHREMFATLDGFLKTHFVKRPFLFVDVGCGDSATIIPILKKRPIDKYIGIDEAEDVLKLASSKLSCLNCKIELIAENMLRAVPSLSSPVDIIFTSYAVHHLSTEEKINFIQSCYNKLKINGFLLMIDGVREHNQTREKWLQALAARLKQSKPDITQEEFEQHLQHSRNSDYPEELNTFKKIATSQGWKHFQVLWLKEIFAFMVFAK